MSSTPDTCDRTAELLVRIAQLDDAIKAAPRYFEKFGLRHDRDKLQAELDARVRDTKATQCQ